MMIMRREERDAKEERNEVQKKKFEQGVGRDQGRCLEVKLNMQPPLKTLTQFYATDRGKLHINKQTQA